MNQLVLAHREKNKEVALLSGVAEDVTERDLLLDELVELLDDTKRVQESKKEEEQKKRQRDEEAFLTARRAAMERLGQSSTEEGRSRLKNHMRIAQLTSAMLKMKELDIKARREEREEERRDRARERAEERSTKLNFALKTTSVLLSC
ncbi:hypothetical protein V7S43_017487 [Phytophthora oleae]